MKKILLAMLLSVFLLSTMTVPILSQDEWTVGVNVGDWFLYEGTLVEYEADEGVPFPPHPTLSILETWNASDCQNYTVTAVSGTTVTFEMVTHYKDGTNETQTFNEDIMSGPIIFNVIGANLEPGVEVRPANPAFGMSAIIINETIVTEYDGLTRETNYCEWTSTYMGVANYQTYYDKATGMRVKHVGNSSLVVAEGNVTCSSVHELVESNVWVIPEFPTGTVMLLIFVAVTVCVDIYRRKKLKRQIG